MNQTGDMTDEEFEKMQGLVLTPEMLMTHSSDDYDEDDLQYDRPIYDRSINWVTRGKVGPVKNQGTCRTRAQTSIVNNFVPLKSIKV